MKNGRRFLATLGIICGIITILFGFHVLAADYGGWKDMTIQFGADFYTESYQATAQSANNILHMAKILRNGFSYLLMSLGAFEALYFGCLSSRVSNASKTVGCESPALEIHGNKAEESE